MHHILVLSSILSLMAPEQGSKVHYTRGLRIHRYIYIILSGSHVMQEDIFCQRFQGSTAHQQHLGLLGVRMCVCARCVHGVCVHGFLD